MFVARSKALAYEYSFPAVSNMLSSWCQYEALKYVTFPTQVMQRTPGLVFDRFETRQYCMKSTCGSWEVYTQEAITVMGAEGIGF